jgi:UDP-N-acetylglucosamine 2-epimerase (non-hydrolysing)
MQRQPPSDRLLGHVRQASELRGVWHSRPYHPRLMTEPRRRKILSVVGTRPNFMKTVPVVAELTARPDRFDHVLVHTGQHYDHAMSRIFFEELGVGEPDHMLGVGSGSHAQQAARVMERLEPVLLDEEPDVVLVPGDVNSTMAAALVASKLMIPVGHIEAGLRSFDRTMPEEINRVVTDSVAELLFTHSPEARDHLLREGRDEAAIHFVGNTMIDTLVAMRPLLGSGDLLARLGLRERSYLVVTLHRPALVDGALLAEAIAALATVARTLPVVFPVHPRTRAAIEARGLRTPPGLRLLDPFGYVDFLALVASAAGVLTDSGGIQEETTYLGVPCFTLRDNTERPVTVELGTNVMLGLDPRRIEDVPALIDDAVSRPAKIPPLWDGQAAGRIVDVLGSVPMRADTVAAAA